MIYGDPDFKLEITGGSGTGAVTFALVSGPAAVTPDGVVAINDAGDIIARPLAARSQESGARSQNITIALQKSCFFRKRFESNSIARSATARSQKSGVRS